MTYLFLWNEYFLHNLCILISLFYLQLFGLLFISLFIFSSFVLLLDKFHPSIFRIKFLMLLQLLVSMLGLLLPYFTFLSLFEFLHSVALLVILNLREIKLFLILEHPLFMLNLKQLRRSNALLFLNFFLFLKLHYEIVALSINHFSLLTSLSLLL